MMEVFVTIRTEEFGSREARELVLSCFNDLVREVDEHGGFVPSTNQPDLEKIEQRELSRERIVDLSSQIESCSFNGGVRKRAEDQLEAHSVSLHQLPTARQIDMLSGVARALLEQQRLFLLRMEDRLACAEPEDPLFRERPAVAPPAGGPLFEAIEAVRGPTVGEAVQQ
ncbi:MAG: hypothetical protein M3Q15_06015 [Pseudomonadota bacterium]|nr:hypothetical protein [Pseudomonadota bacterium]